MWCIKYIIFLMIWHEAIIMINWHFGMGMKQRHASFYLVPRVLKFGNYKVD